MEEARLQALLKRADSEGTAADPADLVGGVLRRQTRQARIRRAAVVAPVLLAATITTWKLSHQTKQDPVVARRPAMPDRMEADRAETDRLGREVAVWLAVARRAEAQERLNRAKAAETRLEILIQSERERAAMVMVRQGDWRRQRGESGAEEYRRAAELFNGTRAAAIARARLGQG